MTSGAHAEHFADRAQQRHASNLGMWVFLSSEVLLFAGLFALYFGSRAHHPAAFAMGVAHNPRLMGSANTAILLCSSYVVASAVHAQRTGHRGRTLGLLAGAWMLGVGFLAVKFTEYGMHFREGVFPGGHGTYFLSHPMGMAPFYTLYFLMTGLHAIHVIVGLAVLAFAASRVFWRAPDEATTPLELGALYWHLVDLIWIFLWPMFYLMGGG